MAGFCQWRGFFRRVNSPPLPLTWALLLFVLFDNAGHRQLVFYYRSEGVIRFLIGFEKWGKVACVGATALVPLQTYAGLYLDPCLLTAS